MNDKNFIEELRQKREEYGVTQRKLAVACGISRTYFNQIENGTVVPSAELKQTIEKQIERFNPQEPLFLLIDYFRVRIPTTDALAIIRDVLQLKSDYMLYEDYGLYIPFQVNHLHGQTEPVPRRMRATLTETEPMLFYANYQATAC